MAGFTHQTASGRLLYVWTASMKVRLKYMLQHVQKVGTAMQRAEVVSQHSQGQNFATSEM